MRARSLMGPLVVAVVVAGCKANVEGEWGGSIGGEPAILELEQRGSTLDGKLCTRSACEQVYGDLEEESVQLACQSCDPPLELDLELDQGQLVGDAYDPTCSCPLDDEACDCTQSAIFQPCDGACDR